MAAAILGTVAASTLVGWLLVRSESSWLDRRMGNLRRRGIRHGCHVSGIGADPLLVAMMQYLRVIFVVLTASLVAGLWLGPDQPVSDALATTSSRSADATSFP